MTNNGTPFGNDDGAGNTPAVVKLDIDAIDALHAAYMPFLSGGGLFVATDLAYRIDDEVCVMLNITVGQPEQIAIAGRVAWVTPAGAHSPRVPGVGVQFIGKGAAAIRSKLEQILGPAMESVRPTRTM